MIRLFGIVDAACDPAIHSLILEIPARACLFAGDVHPEVAAAAPWIVELVPDAELSSEWQSKGWRQNWGILLRSELLINGKRQLGPTGFSA
ncbi:DUF4123 domain-containing protein [Roseovarius sp. D22-M7]|uniref:DUF4123 domain-containing protein n=1 Tax=Roseovarius sp. D22-M7 TaxID=3127116 RepID=UPI003FA7BBCC